MKNNHIAYNKNSEYLSKIIVTTITVAILVSLKFPLVAAHSLYAGIVGGAAGAALGLGVSKFLTHDDFDIVKCAIVGAFIGAIKSIYDTSKEDQENKELTKDISPLKIIPCVGEAVAKNASDIKDCSSGNLIACANAYNNGSHDVNDCMLGGDYA